MKTEATTRTLTCDACGGACEPVRRFSVVVGHDREFVREIVFDVRLVSPYQTDDGDVCDACLRKALEYRLRTGASGRDLKPTCWERGVSEPARETMRCLGAFGPTLAERDREVKGWLNDGESGASSAYWSSGRLRAMAAHFVEVADWLDRRAETADDADRDR